MKKLLLILMALFLWAGSSWAVTVQIGSGTTTTTYFPIYSCYGYNYSQQIYLASEITLGGGGAGQIEKIRFYYNSSGTTYANWTNWTVYLGNTSKTTFTSTTDWVPVGSMTQVFSGNIPTPVAGTWLELTLTGTFNWDGASNIVVAVDENSAGYSCTAAWRSFASGSNRGILYYSDGTNPNPSSPPTANYGPNPTLAQIQFEMQPATACSGTPDPGNTISSTNPACSGENFTLSVENGTLGTGVTYQWQSSTTGGAPWTNMGTSATQVTSQTVATYYRCEVTCDGNTGTSNPLLVNMNLASVPYNEGFITTATPACWNITGWSIGAIRGVTGNPGNNIYKNLYSAATTGTFTTGVIGPVVSGMVLTFDYKLANYSSPYGPPAAGSGNYVVSVSGNGGVSYDVLETVVNDGTAGWQSKSYPLTSYDGSNIMIRIVGNWVSGDYDLAFDNIKVEFPPTCFPPTAPTTTNVNATGATFGWTSPDSFFDIFVQVAGLPAPNAGTTPTENNWNANSYTWTGGSMGNSYDWYVRTDCDAGGGIGQSSWLGPQTFSISNDFCGLAISVSCGNTYSGSTAGATPDAPGACGAANYTYPGVWYHFAGIGDMVSVNLCTGTTWDSQISVYSGACGSLVCVDGNDDYCALQSRVDWFAETGVDYYILVHQYGASGGAFTLTVDCTHPVTAIWQGDDTSPSSVDWFGADNWDVADVPGSTTDVIIPAGLSWYPTIDRKGTCNDIYIASGARLVDMGSGYLIPNGTATVEQNYAGSEWHLISAPVTGATANMFLGLYLQNHVESTNTYYDITNIATPLNVMQGYALWNDMAGTATFTGALNTGDYYMGVTRSGLGWNLTGNPYPSPIDWLAAAGWTKTNVNDATYRHVNNATWATFVGGVGANGGTRYIAPNQGFFVEVTDGETIGTLGMTNDVRTHSTAPFFKDEIADIVRIEVSGNGFVDETVIRFLDIATPGFDGQWDAHKLFGTVADAPSIYSSDNGMMAINSLPATNTVPVGVKAGVPGEFTITATETSEFADVILEDLLTGTFTDLKSNPYTFNYDMNFDNRFIVHFTPLAIGENATDLINIYSSQKDVYVSVPANTAGDIVVYNLMGQEVARTQINGTINKVTVEKSAYYLVKVMSNESVVTKKVFVK